MHRATDHTIPMPKAALCVECGAVQVRAHGCGELAYSISCSTSQMPSAKTSILLAAHFHPLHRNAGQRHNYSLPFPWRHSRDMSRE